MRVAIITNEELKQELLVQGMAGELETSWLDVPAPQINSLVCIDLLFDATQERLEQLKQTGSAIIIINDVVGRVPLPANMLRINGWRSFLKRPVLEAAGGDEATRKIVEKIMRGFTKTIEWTPDQPGFITARVVAMIINEAFLALEEKVSTREAIDTAMKLGTNYPYGPFEWSKLIGAQKIVELLETMAKTNARYQPGTLLKQEALIT